MRQVSITSFRHLGALFLLLCRDLPVSCGQWEAGLGLWMGQGRCPLARTTSVHLLCTPAPKVGVAFGSSQQFRHQTCWKQDLGITIMFFLQSFVLNHLNCHGN